MIAEKENYIWILGLGIAAYLINVCVNKYFLRDFADSVSRKVVGKVTGLWIYPLKSCKGEQIERGYANIVGLSSADGLTDRWFTVRFSKNNMKVTARDESSLLHICVKKVLNKKIFEFSAPEMETLQIDLSKPNMTEKVVTNVFGDKVDCFDAGDEAAEWITKYIGKSCRISFDPTRDLRQDAKHWSRNWRLNDQKIDQNLGSFSDKYPYLLLGDDSLADVNLKIPNKNYTPLSFRPNIMMKSESGKAWAEDEWVGEIHIGDAIFAAASPCARCIFTTIDPITGKRSEDGEPLKTLKTFRLASGRDRNYMDQYRGDPMVGVCLVLIKPGKIDVNDEIVLYSK